MISISAQLVTLGWGVEVYANPSLRLTLTLTLTLALALNLTLTRSMPTPLCATLTPTLALTLTRSTPTLLLPTRVSTRAECYGYRIGPMTWISMARSMASSMTLMSYLVSDRRWHLVGSCRLGSCCLR